MIVGLGTGSTAAAMIKHLSRRIEDEGLDVVGIPTSYATEILAVNMGVPVGTLAEYPVIDIGIDGADQVSRDLYVVKGGGAAHTREKIIAYSSERYIIIVDEGKLSDSLDHPVPVEIIPSARQLVESQLQSLGGSPELRIARRKDGPVITDNGNLVLDVDFGEIDEPRVLATAVSSLSGVVEHGLFLDVYEVMVARESGRVEILTR